MYYYISGKLVVKEPAFVVIDAGGVGYELKISLNTWSAIKNLEQAKLFTFYYVREDTQTLYGFADEEEKRMFTLLIGVSGIGPSTGLMLFSSLTTTELREALLTGNVKLIQSVKGIGAKTAQRVVLELKDKINKGAAPAMPGVAAAEIPAAQGNYSTALEALTALGIQKSAAEKNIQAVLKQHGSQLPLEEIIKLSLKVR